MDSTHYAFEWDCEYCDVGVPAAARPARTRSLSSHTLADRRAFVDGARSNAQRLDNTITEATSADYHKANPTITTRTR